MDKGCPDPHGTGRVSFPVKASLRPDPESGVRRQHSGGPQSSGHKAGSGPRPQPSTCPLSALFTAPSLGASKLLEPTPLVWLPPPLSLPKVARSLLVASPWLWCGHFLPLWLWGLGEGPQAEVAALSSGGRS